VIIIHWAPTKSMLSGAYSFRTIMGTASKRQAGILEQ
jgi:hypothetical protein